MPKSHPNVLLKSNESISRRTRSKTCGIPRSSADFAANTPPVALGLWPLPPSTSTPSHSPALHLTEDKVFFTRYKARHLTLALMKYYDEEPHPNIKRRRHIASVERLSLSQVSGWFQRARRRVATFDQVAECSVDDSTLREGSPSWTEDTVSHPTLGSDIDTLDHDLLSVSEAAFSQTDQPECARTVMEPSYGPCTRNALFVPEGRLSTAYQLLLSDSLGESEAPQGHAENEVMRNQSTSGIQPYSSHLGEFIPLYDFEEIPGLDIEQLLAFPSPLEPALDEMVPDSTPTRGEGSVWDGLY